MFAIAVGIDTARVGIRAARAVTRGARAGVGPATGGATVERGTVAGGPTDLATDRPVWSDAGWPVRSRLAATLRRASAPGPAGAVVRVATVAVGATGRGPVGAGGESGRDRPDSFDTGPAAPGAATAATVDRWSDEARGTPIDPIRIGASDLATPARAAADAVADGGIGSSDAAGRAAGIRAAVPCAAPGRTAGWASVTAEGVTGRPYVGAAVGAIGAGAGGWAEGRPVLRRIRRGPAGAPWSPLGSVTPTREMAEALRIFAAVGAVGTLGRTRCEPPGTKGTGGATWAASGRNGAVASLRLAMFDGVAAAGSGVTAAPGEPGGRPSDDARSTDRRRSPDGSSCRPTTADRS